MSESAYNWGEKNEFKPQPGHATKNTVWYWAWKHFDDRGREGRYMAWLTKALCGEEQPSLNKRHEKWSQIAYSIYVQRPLPNLKTRPTSTDLKDSGEPFLALIEKLRPARVVITGKIAWNGMPECAISPHGARDFGAYRISNDDLVWCMAVPHPRAPIKGNRWHEVSAKIQDFKSRDLPTKYHPELEALKW